MDPRCRAASLRPTAHDKRRHAPNVGMKETSLVLLPPSPKHHASAPSAHAAAAAALSSPARNINGQEKEILGSTFTTFDKHVADARISGTESETSRSSTPVTDASWCLSSRSSFATSGQVDGECGYPRDEDSCATKSDNGSESVPGETKKMEETDMAAANGVLNPRMLRQSHLRHSLSARSAASAKSNSDISEKDTSTDSEEECEVLGDEDDDSDNDWSGENDSLDAVIVEALDGDLSLAAFLIPLIHREKRNSARNKVDSWQVDSTPAKDDEEGSGEGVSSARPGGSVSAYSGDRGQGRAPNQPRKRRRRPSRSENEQDDDDEEGRNGGISTSVSADRSQILLLACPFHKLDPIRYGIQHNSTTTSRKDHYRACAGPGFKSIQRLKEHLKRKHTPVQCDRCYDVFNGPDKASCMNELTEHRRREVPCQTGEPSLKEGISEAQWALLDKQNRKKSQERHKVEKWFEIWQVLFPEHTVPETPWYDIVPMRYQTPSRDSEAFHELFYTMLSHKMQHGDISFPSYTAEEVAQRLKSLIQQAFRTFVSLHGPMSRTTDTSSSQTGTNNLHSSRLGGSSTHQSHPTNSTSQVPLTATSHTTATLVSLPPPQLQLQLQHPPQSSPQPGRPYTLNVAGAASAAAAVPGVPYGVPAISAHRRVVQHMHPHYTPATTASMSPAHAHPGTPIMNAVLTANSTFTGHNPDDPASFYNVPMPWTPGGVAYATGAIPVASTMSPAQYSMAAAAANQQINDAGHYAPVSAFYHTDGSYSPIQ